MSVIEFAKTYAEKLPALSATFEAERRLTPDVAKDFAAGGVFHMLVPKEYGGLEVHPSEFVEVLKTLARGDGSAGWNAMIGSTTGVLSASLNAETAHAIYGEGPGRLSVGVTAPMGKANKVEGGYQISGRWPFGSGSQNADWIGGGCFVFENGEQVFNQFGPEVRIMMFRKDQVEIEDTWYVTGLKGTGSHHFNVKDQFVAANYSIVLGGKTQVKAPLYSFPLLGLLAIGVSSVSLGIGFKALDAVTELAGVKSPTGSNKKLIERPMVQSNVAKSIADLESAEAYIHKVISDAWAIAESGERLNNDTKAKLRLAAANATHSAVAAVDRLYEIGGGTSIYENNTLQQCMRDIHVTTQHAMVAQPIYEVTGKVALGMDPRQLL